MNRPDDQLDPRLRLGLERLKAVPARDPQSALRGRAAFLAQAKSLKSNVAPSTRLHRGGWTMPFARRLSFAMTAAVLLVLCAMLGGTGATVYAAQSSLPDTPLYPIKIMSEDAQTALAFQPKAKMGLLLSFADRRVNEIQTLNQRGTALPASVTGRLQQQLDDALSLGAELQDADLKPSLERVRTTVERQKQTLTRVQASAPAPSGPMLNQVQNMLGDRLRLAEDGLRDPPGFRQQMRGRGQTVPMDKERSTTATPPEREHHATITMPTGVRSTITSIAPDRHPTTTPLRPERRIPEASPMPERRPIFVPPTRERRETEFPPRPDWRATGQTPGTKTPTPTPFPRKDNSPGPGPGGQNNDDEK